ncbi:MAG: hypothetical protein AAGD43_18070 [Pseudomonadota bacterium]
MADQNKECKPAGLRAAHELRMCYLHTPEPNTSLDDVTKPGYWKHVHRELGRAPHALIECIAKDQSWEATLRVFATGDGFAKVRVLNHWKAEAKPGRQPKLPEGWASDWVEHGWRVRNADGEIVVDKQATEHDAISAASQLHKKMAA